MLHFMPHSFLKPTKFQTSHPSALFFPALLCFHSLFPLNSPSLFSCVCVSLLSIPLCKKQQSTTLSHTTVAVSLFPPLSFFSFLPFSILAPLHENRVPCFAMKYLRSNSFKRLFSFGRRSFEGEKDESLVVAPPCEEHPLRPSWKCFSYEELFHATNGFSSGTSIFSSSVLFEKQSIFFFILWHLGD